MNKNKLIGKNAEQVTPVWNMRSIMHSISGNTKLLGAGLLGANLLGASLLIANSLNDKMPDKLPDLPTYEQSAPKSSVMQAATLPETVPIALPLISNTAPKEIIVDGVGDVTLGYFYNRYFDDLVLRSGLETAISYPFLNVKNHFSQSITVANLEGTLTEHDKPQPKKYTFKGPAIYAKSLKEASIEVVNMANNHAYDFGSKGMIDTLITLDDAEILHVGAGINLSDAVKPVIVERDGIKVGFLGFAYVGRESAAGAQSAGVAPAIESIVTSSVESLKKQSDVVIVSYHFGNELEHYPGESQKRLAKLAIDSGASAVFGHHPHVLQGVESYGDGVIFYSLANFCFGGNTGPQDKDSIIARLYLSKNGVRAWEAIPVRIAYPPNANYQPYFPNEDETKRILLKLDERTRGIK